MQIAESKPPLVVSGEDAELNVAFDFYQTFWGLQVSRVVLGRLKTSLIESMIVSLLQHLGYAARSKWCSWEPDKA
jgi:hypothetical protein